MFNVGHDANQSLRAQFPLQAKNGQFTDFGDAPHPGPKSRRAPDLENAFPNIVAWVLGSDNAAGYRNYKPGVAMEANARMDSRQIVPVSSDPSIRRRYTYPTTRADNPSR